MIESYDAVGNLTIDIGQALGDGVGRTRRNRALKRPCTTCSIWDDTVPTPTQELILIHLGWRVRAQGVTAKKVTVKKETIEAALTPRHDG